MGKKILLIDMDEVLVEKFTLYLYNLFTGQNRNLESFTKQYLQDEIEGQNEKMLFFDYIFSRRNVYDNIPLIEGVEEVLPKLNEKYNLYICTDFLFKGCEEKCGKILLDKFEMLGQVFPYIKPSQYIFMKAKKLLACDIIIDDRIQNFGSNHKKCLLYTRYHNKNIKNEELPENTLRVDNWMEIENLLI